MRRRSRPSGKFIALRDAEAEYAIPYHTIYRWIERRLIPRLDEDVAGRAIRIRRADLDAFLEAHLS